MTFQNARFLEQADGAVDRGNGYTGIDGRGALVKLFYVGMILRLRKDACNHTALLCDSQSFFSAKCLNVDFSVHCSLRARFLSEYRISPFYINEKGGSSKRPAPIMIRLAIRSAIFRGDGAWCPNQFFLLVCAVLRILVGGVVGKECVSPCQ